MSTMMPHPEADQINEHMHSSGTSQRRPMYKPLPEGRRRASIAIRMRMNELSVTVPKLARVAGIDQSTVRSLLSGTRWPVRSTLSQLEPALGWPVGEITRIAEGRPELAEFTALELLAELLRRAQAAKDGI